MPTISSMIGTWLERHFPFLPYATLKTIPEGPDLRIGGANRSSFSKQSLIALAQQRLAAALLRCRHDAFDRRGNPPHRVDRTD
ncbi:hypothetical protein [Bradyrhizobium sp. 76]|uniref:hypothetical protein n=1 Tax=Bradyrhizobium sp. 76 TaxID=2782680 RepID=UPI001FFA1A2B|nr:hypothetical protein [Bradyrhizobium sp. 76]